MICDIVDIKKYKYYKAKDGPFVIIFFEEYRDKSNFELYAFLKGIEKSFNDVPLIRFDYEKFIAFYPNENIPTSNHLMVIQKLENPKFHETTDKLNIPIILHSVRAKRLGLKKIKSKYYKFNNKAYMRPWIANNIGLRSKDITKFINMPAETQYKFPNNTANISQNITKSYIWKKSMNELKKSKKEENINQRQKLISRNEIDKLMFKPPKDTFKHLNKSNHLLKLLPVKETLSYLDSNSQKETNQDFFIQNTVINLLRKKDQQEKLFSQKSIFINANNPVSLSLENSKNILKSPKDIFAINNRHEYFLLDYKLPKYVSSNLNEQKNYISIHADDKKKNYVDILLEHSYCLPQALDISK